MRIKAGHISVFIAGLAAQAAAQTPLSAIDWLSNSIETPIVLPAPTPRETPSSRGIRDDTITVTPLDAISPDAVGLLPISVTGLPRDLWGQSSSAELAQAFGALDTGLLPAAQELLFTLLLAELDPPQDGDASGQLFLARIDALLALGAVEQAQALLERAGTDDPVRFRRWFDVSLLTGTEARACAQLRNSPGLAPTMPARIFCLARNGNWNVAALTLETGRALGQMTGADDAVLTRFLDAEVFEGAPPLPIPSRPSPLIFRLYEAIGEPLPTSNLPLAFAHADLNPNAGWKAQIEAAERLARSGAIDDNVVIALYLDRKPAASGGVWRRVAALHAFDEALSRDDTERLRKTLPVALDAMHQVSLEVVFARSFSDRLNRADLDNDTRVLAWRTALLTRDYETAANDFEPADFPGSAHSMNRFLHAVAKGEVQEAAPPNAIARAVQAGFSDETAPDDLTDLVQDNQLGLAILRAIDLVDKGVEGNLSKLTDALAFLRSVGLEDAARRIALQVLLVDRRG